MTNEIELISVIGMISGGIEVKESLLKLIKGATGLY
jgi:hypothetical protein